MRSRPAALPGMILAYGGGTMVSQVLILRELLALAQGQELKLALALWCWLLWVGLGSLLGARPGARSATPARLGLLLLWLGLLLPATILMARALPALAQVPGGRSLPPGLAFLMFLALLGPFGLASGYFFPSACRVLAASSPTGAVGRVYYLETLGAAVGVCLLQLFLLGRFPNLGLALGFGLFLALGAGTLARPPGVTARLIWGLSLLALAAALFWLPRLENQTRTWQWPGRQVLATVDSPYALLTASREGEQLTFYANNLWFFTYPDPLSAEQQVQLGLLQHPQPRRVLLLGGGAAGLVPEILKTSSVTVLDYVELDPQLVEMAQQLLPEAGGLGREPRLRTIYQDARHFLAHTRERYDVILMALPEPQNAQLNRYYTREFFAIVASRLEPQGVFSFSLTGSETSLHPLRAAYLGLTYHTLREVFPQVLVFPGERARFFAGSTPGTMGDDPEHLVARLQERRLDLRYVREYYLRHDLSRPRLEYLRAVLEAQPREVNTDLNPRCYFYDLVLSGLQEGLPVKEVLLFLQGLPTGRLWAALFLGTAFLGLLVRRRAGPQYLYQVLAMGLGTMALEILVLILYQIHLGYLYRQLGILIAAFMAGMAAGGAVINGWARRASPGKGLLAGLQGGLAVLSLLVALGLTRGPAFWPETEWLTQVLFVLILTAAGFGGGGVFALSAALWTRARPDSGAASGVLYAADLAGATLGALGISLLVVPVWGILPALYLVAAIHAGAGLVLLGARD